MLHAQEVLSGDANMLIKSRVKVTYVKLNGTDGFPLHSVHFDYGPPMAGHAMFHAQLADEAVEIPERQKREMNLEFSLSGELKCFQFARIPTADMSLSSVLLCIVADHVNLEQFRDYLAVCKKLDMPVPSFPKMMESLSPMRTFNSHHWFADCP
ncbi:MAG: hypothetical protein U0930_14290 [Pirellulales bacterium]